MKEETLEKILKMYEEGSSWQEILKIFPEAEKELRETQAVIALLESSRKDVAPSTHLLEKILAAVPLASNSNHESKFSRLTAMILKVGAPLAVAAATFVLVLTIKTPAAPEQDAGQIALKQSEDSLAASDAAPSLMMAAPEQKRTAAESPIASNASVADQAADQALASSFYDGSGSDAAAQNYFDESALNAYDQSVSNNPI